MSRLKALKAALLKAEDAIKKALWADFHKPPFEVDVTEMTATIFELDHAIRYLKSWMKPLNKPTPLYLMGTDTHVSYFPKGPSLIIAPWNYSILLTIGPIVHATAAGCPFVVKPSENTPEASLVIKNIIESVFPPEEASVFLGGKDVATELLAQPFSHLHFTGSAAIGKIVMKAGAQNLSSVTLELGGKSPTYVDATADLKLAAESICFGKFSNSGQTCIAPDYILADRRIYKALLKELKLNITYRYGATFEDRHGDDYARIVQRPHFDRLVTALEDAKSKGATVEFGGGSDASDLFIEPTILTDVPASATLMQEEIFGPILPVLVIDSVEEAIQQIQQLPPPLSTYVFSKSVEQSRKLSAGVRTGAVCTNTTLLQFIQPFGPFGGEGNSGIGRSHGEAGFRAFSNEQVVLRRKWGARLLNFASPPYSRTTTWFTRLLQKLS